MSADQTPEKGFSLDGLKKLEAAIQKGVRRVKYTDKEIEYASIDDMLRARDVIRACLGLTKKKGQCGLFGGRRVNARHSKGLSDCSSGDENEHGEKDERWNK